MAQHKKYLKMTRTALALLPILASLMASCQRMSNNYQRQVIDCGDLAGASDSQLYRIADFETSNADVWEVDSTTIAWRRLPINDKGCFRSSSPTAGHLIVRSRSQESPKGTVISKESSEGIRLISMKPLQLSDQIPDICPEKNVYVSQNSLNWQVKLSSQEDRDYFFIVEPEERKSQASASLLRSGESSLGNLALSDLNDGTNEIKFALYDLLRSDRKLSEQTCKFIVDKKKPTLSVRDTKNQDLAEISRVFAPGEKLFISTSEAAQVQYCIAEEGGAGTPACTSLRSDSSLDLPRSGLWTLQFQAKDSSGNVESRRFAIEVFDQNAVDLIKERAQLNLTQANRNQAQVALELEESRQKLVGKREQVAAEPDTRVAMLSSMLRTQEISRVPQKCVGASEILQVGKIVLTFDSNGELCAYRENGEFLYQKNLETLSALLHKKYKIFQDRFVIYGYGDDPRFRDQLHVFDTQDGSDKSIAAEIFSDFIDDFDINPRDGSIYILTKSKSRSGIDSYLELSFDGEVKLRKDLRDGRYTYVSYLPLPKNPKIVLGYSTYLSSREILNPEFCDLTLALCEKRSDLSPDFKEVFINQDGDLLATHFQNKTFLWELRDSTDLNLNKAKESPGTFVQFLPQGKSYITRNMTSYSVDSVNNRNESRLIFGTLEPSVNMIYDEKHQQTLLMNEGGFERWTSKFTTSDKAAADEKVRIRDAYVRRGVLNDQGNELTVFSSQYIARYQLAYANLNSYYLFAGDKSGIMALPLQDLLIYTNAEGVSRKFASGGITDSVMLTPQKKFVLLQSRAFEGKNLQLINAAGETVASAQGDAFKITLADTNVDESRLLYRLDQSDFILFDASKTDNVKRYSFENFDEKDTMLLPKLDGQVIVVQQDAIKLVDTETNQQQLLAVKASAVQTGKQFPIITYIEDSETTVLRNLLTGKELRWNNASSASIEEDCHSLFIKQLSSKTLSIVDLRNFESHDYPEGQAVCLQASGQVALETSQTESSSLLLDSNYQVLASLPSTTSWISANQQGILVQKDLDGVEFFSYSFKGELLGRREFNIPRSKALFIGSEMQDLKHSFMLTEQSTLTGPNPNQHRYEFFDSQLKLVASSVLFEGESPQLLLELLGPILWNHSINQLHEMTDPTTQGLLIEFLPVPHWEGIRFYPLENTKLYNILSQWIDSMKNSLTRSD